MGIAKPYRRTCRQLSDGTYGDGGHWQYLLHAKYAKEPAHYIRAYLLLQKDLLSLFDYVEPSDRNKDCYSYRIHEILLRACVEVEANCKAILLENAYTKPKGDLNMDDYKKIEISHQLSGFSVKVPTWNGSGEIRRPFAPWATGQALPWYQAYNATKHDRHSAFQLATFERMLDAVSGCLVLLSSQFWTHEYSPADWGLSVGGRNDGMDSAIGQYFRVAFPGWPTADRYEFDWHALEKSDPDPFQLFQYP